MDVLPWAFYHVLFRIRPAITWWKVKSSTSGM